MNGMPKPTLSSTIPAARSHRIRSFVRREGHFTPAQQRAFTQHWQHYGLDYTGRLRDFDAVFDRQAPRVLEIGFGNGEAMAWSVLHDPNRDHIGIEVHRPGVGRLLNTLATQTAIHARVYKHDAVEVLQHEIAPLSLDEVRIWFPDPWQKKRHHKRRLIQATFAELLASRVRPSGLLHLATDWADYAEHMFAIMDAASAWRNRAGSGQASARPPWRIATRFEQRGLRLGHGIWDLLYDRR